MMYVWGAWAEYLCTYPATTLSTTNPTLASYCVLQFFLIQKWSMYKPAVSLVTMQHLLSPALGHAVPH
jgi:hypothetical protein